MATNGRSWATFWGDSPPTEGYSSLPFSTSKTNSRDRVLRPDVGDFSESFVDDLLEFSPDIGAPLRRNRTSRNFSMFDVSFVMSVPQWEAFKRFYRDYTGNGTLSFYFPDYNSDITEGVPVEEIEVQFYGEKPIMSTVGPIYRKVSFKVLQLNAPTPA